MTVTKETYTAAATWTASQLATLFEDAFIDAGLMTAWFDSFLSGTVENRILEITYNGAKTYGKAYYWFMFTTTSINISIASGWNVSTDVPTGTQYLDFYSTATNTTANHDNLALSLATATAAELVRYTDSGYSWFVFRNSATSTPFFIAPAATGVASWIDMDKVFFHHFIFGVSTVTNATSTSVATVDFRSAITLRRSFYSQGINNQQTAVSGFNRRMHTLGYVAAGNSVATTGNYSEVAVAGRNVLVPYGFNNTNPAYTANSFPVIKGYSYSYYTTSNMPADFGIFFNYGTTSFAFGDRIVVSAGVEEWEIYGFANNTSADNASALIVARVV